MREHQFDGLVGPTHHYAGLSPGNLASQSHAGQPSNPRAAALEGLTKMRRVRELGVLRAAGMTRRQVRRTVVVEAGILGISGSVLGIVTGLAAGALMIVLAGGTLRIGLDLPWPSIGLAALLGVGLSMLAAWYPARMASRLGIVRAVQHE